MDTNQLVVGHTYYRLTFADRDFTMPGVEPMVYIGNVAEDGRSMLAFQDTVSYVRFGSRLDMSEDNDEIVVELIEPEAIGESIPGVNAISARSGGSSEACGLARLSNPAHIAHRVEGCFLTNRCSR
jgi:hypothetical protein